MTDRRACEARGDGERAAHGVGPRGVPRLPAPHRATRRRRPGRDRGPRADPPAAGARGVPDLRRARGRLRDGARRRDARVLPARRRPRGHPRIRRTGQLRRLARASSLHDELRTRAPQDAGPRPRRIDRKRRARRRRPRPRLTPDRVAWWCAAPRTRTAWPPRCSRRGCRTPACAGAPAPSWPAGGSSRSSSPASQP